MNDRPPLHVVFTMDCQPAATKLAPEGPRGWEQSARAIDGYCTRLLRAGFSPTLFLTPQCAQMHQPLLEDMAESGVELGLYVQPPSLPGGRFNRHLGQYGREGQQAAVTLALEGYQDALGRRPRSFRSAFFSASDDTFPLLYALGFQQGSISSPGRRIDRHAAVWSGAAPDAHYVDPTSRLASGDLPFLEVPITTDATQERGGISPDLTLESGTFEKWHLPLLEGQLRRLDSEAQSFRVLCVATRNCFPYNRADDQQRVTLDRLVEYLDELEERHEVIPTTLAGAHASFRAQRQG